MATSIANNLMGDVTSSATRAMNAGQWSQLSGGAAQDDSRDFGSILFSHSADNGNKKSTPQQVRHAAEQLVAGTFVLPILTQMRQEASKDQLFSGGQTAQAFGQQLDTMLADRIVHRSNFSVVDQVANRFLKQKAGAAISTTGRIDQHG